VKFVARGRKFLHEIGPELSNATRCMAGGDGKKRIDEEACRRPDFAEECECESRRRL